MRVIKNQNSNYLQVDNSWGPRVSAWQYADAEIDEIPGNQGDGTEEPLFFVDFSGERWNQNPDQTCWLGFTDGMAISELI